MSEEEIKLDRYAKFRALGHFEEHLVPGGQWRETRAARAKASACSPVLPEHQPLLMLLLLLAKGSSLRPKLYLRDQECGRFRTCPWHAAEERSVSW